LPKKGNRKLSKGRRRGSIKNEKGLGTGAKSNIESKAKDKMTLEVKGKMQAKVSKGTLRAPAKLYRIGELVRYTPFSRQTIHNYTVMGLIREAEWTEGGHRLYDESVFERLRRIMELRETMSLWEIKRILNKEDAARKTAEFNPESDNN